MTEPKSTYSVDGKVPYKDSSQSPEEHVGDLLSRMTLEEKVAQRMGLWNEKNETLVNENGDFDLEKAKNSFSSVTRPVKELKGFKKVWLQPDETKIVELEITRDSLAFWDINMKYTVEPGGFEVMVGNSSRDEDLKSIILKVENVNK